MKGIEEIIDGIDRLKPVPHIAQKIMAISEDPLSSMQQLAEVIQYDQAMTAHILRTCNSAFFGLPRKVDSITHAVTYLGMDQVTNMVLLKVGSLNLKGPQEGYALQEGELWKYSVSSALIAKDMANHKGIADKHLVFTAALLKDIGKVILSRFVQESYEVIERLVSHEGRSFGEAEKAVIGIDHAELGAMVAERWRFSDKMVDIIRNHHLNEAGPDLEVETMIVYLADTLCMMMGIGVGSDGLAYRFHREAADALGLTEKDVQLIIANFGEKFRAVEELIGSS